MKKMMKLVNKSSQLHMGPWIFRVSLFSTTQTQPSSSDDTLQQRLLRCAQQRVSAIPVLDKWVVDGRLVDHEDLKGFLKFFRKNRHFKSALEIAEWMSDMKHFDITPEHVAIQLDLIGKVHGTEQTEHYFNSLEDHLQGLPVYGALLNCYASTKSLEKAEAVMEEIRKLNSYSCLCYNTMLNLYSQLGKHEKLDSLMQEMEDKGITFNEVTYNIRLNAYATSSDMEGMEKLLMKMEVDPQVTINFHTYVTAAKGYHKAGTLEKASVVLKKAEHLIKRREGSHAYRIILSVYATMQRKKDVDRLWNRLKKDKKSYNRNYICMTVSLEKLGDIDGAKKILKEWEEKNNSFDIRIPNTVIGAYCRKGHVSEAESILNRLVEAGKEPNASTWSFMSLGYYKSGQMESAVEMTKKALLASFPEWRPDLPTVAACLVYLIDKGDADGTQEILMLLEKCGKFSEGFKERIERYVHERKPRSEALAL